LLRILIGEFEYREYIETNSYFTPIFFMAYIFIVFFVIINMFIAIISEYYDRVKTKESLEMQYENDPLLISFADKMKIMMLNKLNPIISICYGSDKVVEKEMVSIDAISKDGETIPKDGETIEEGAVSQGSNQTVEQEINNIFITKWKNKVYKSTEFTELNSIKKNYSKQELLDKRTQVKLEIEKIITKAEDRLSKSTNDRSATDLYNNFIRIWETLSDYEKENTLNQHDLSIILESEEDAGDLIKLYNQYWVHNDHLNELNGMETMEGMLKKLMDKVDELNKKIS